MVSVHFSLQENGVSSRKKMVSVHRKKMVSVHFSLQENGVSLQGRKWCQFIFPCKKMVSAFRKEENGVSSFFLGRKWCQFIGRKWCQFIFPCKKMVSAFMPPGWRHEG
jgi:hypothetical protein